MNMSGGESQRFVRDMARCCEGDNLMSLNNVSGGQLSVRR